MIILNETVIIDPQIQVEWLNWIKSTHMPAMMATGYFNSYRLLEVLNSPNEGFTYCVQYTAANMDQYEAYQNTVAQHFKNVHMQKFENKLVLFESIMQQLN